MDIKDRLTRLIKYILVNVIILIGNFFLYIIFIEIFHIWYILSNIFSYAIAVIVSFFLNKYIVFRQEAKITEMAEFVLMKFIVGVLSTAALWLLVDCKGMNEYVGAVSVTGFFFLLSYFFSKMIFMFQNRLNDLFKLLRVKHWIKNILIFLPAICGAKFLTNIECLKISAIAFAGMCFLSSVVYILNDICDFNSDLCNPRKQQHPLIAGRMTMMQAKKYLLICLLCFCCFLYMLYVLLELKIWFTILVFALIYLMINVGYSMLGLKNIPVLELFILVLGYIIRLELGGVVTETPVSNYLLLTMIGISLYMVAEKRFAEKRDLDIEQRNCIRMYSESWLKKVMNLGLVFSMVFFSLWALERFQTEYTVFLIVGALILYLLYSFDVERFSEGDPVTIVYKDKVLLILGIIYFLAVMALLLIIH